MISKHTEGCTKQCSPIFLRTTFLTFQQISLNVTSLNAMWGSRWRQTKQCSPDLPRTSSLFGSSWQAQMMHSGHFQWKSNTVSCVEGFLRIFADHIQKGMFCLKLILLFHLFTSSLSLPSLEVIWPEIYLASLQKMTWLALLFFKQYCLGDRCQKKYETYFIFFWWGG